MNRIMLWIFGNIRLDCGGALVLRDRIKVDYKRVIGKDGSPEPAITEDENDGREIGVFRTARATAHVCKRERQNSEGATGAVGEGESCEEEERLMPPFVPLKLTSVKRFESYDSVLR